MKFCFLPSPLALWCRLVVIAAFVFYFTVSTDRMGPQLGSVGPGKVGHHYL